jgi:hypothetical protein
MGDRLISTGCVGIAPGYGFGRNSIPGRVKNVLFCMSSIPVVGLSQPPIQWIPGDISHGVKRLGHEADTHLQLVTR